jgi:hypothetical protein
MKSFHLSREPSCHKHVRPKRSSRSHQLGPARYLGYFGGIRYPNQLAGARRGADHSQYRRRYAKLRNRHANLKCRLRPLQANKTDESTLKRSRHGFIAEASRAADRQLGPIQQLANLQRQPCLSDWLFQKIDAGIETSLVHYGITRITGHVKDLDLGSDLLRSLS